MLRIQELESPNWLKQKYLEEGLTAKEIGDLFDCSKTTVLHRLEKFGIPRRETRAHISSLLYRDAGWLRKQYWDKEVSTKDMASFCGVHKSAIEHWMKKHNIPFRERANQLCSDAKWLREKYWDDGLSTEEIAKLAGLANRGGVRRWLVKHGIPCRSSGEARILKLGYAQYKNKEWLREHYVEKELSSYEIARQIGCGFQTVCRWLDEFDIPRRDWVAHFRYENRDSLWNDKFFDELTHDGAYIIGMIIAEGSLSKIDTSRNRVQIVQKDRTILDKISAIVYGGNFNKVNGSWTLTLNSKHVHEVLTGKFGFPTGKEKSYTVRIPKCLLEREDLLPHCIRGIFDGDGSVNKGGGSFGFSSGSLELLNDIVGVLIKLVSLPVVEPKWKLGGYIKKDGERSGAYYIDYGGVLDAMDFAKFIYGLDLDVYGSTLYLERKRECFRHVCDKWRGREWLCEQIKEGKTNKDIAVELGVSSHRVTKVLNGIGVYDFPYKNLEWLRNAIEIHGRSIKNVGEEFSVRNDEVKYYCDKYDIAYIPVKPMPKEIDSPEWLRGKYWEEGLTMKAIANLAGVALNTIVNRMNKHNISRRCTRYNWNLELGI